MAPEQLLGSRGRWQVALSLALTMTVTSACGDSDAGRLGGQLDSGPGPTVDAALDDAGEAGMAPSDPDPELGPDALSALAGLHYDPTPPPADVSNKYADLPTARAFGQRLFFEKSLSGRLLNGDNDGSAQTLGVKGEAGRVSCAGCHVPSAHFIDNRSPHLTISLGAEWGQRRTPTLLEIAFAPLYNWDGRRDTLWGQAIGVFESRPEFNSGRLFIAQQIYREHRAEYEAIFGAMPKLDDAQTYPQLSPLQTGCDAGPIATAPCRGKPGDGADYDNMTPTAQQAVTLVTVNAAKAIAAYLRQLRCGAGRFERWLDGDATALTRSEQRGAAVFVGKGKCVSCHSGPNLTDGKFHNVGLRPAIVATAFVDIDDRGAATGVEGLLTDPLNTKGAFSDGDPGVVPSQVTPAMEGAFRTPTLRCAADHPSYMHTGQWDSLRQVVSFFNRGGDEIGYPGQSEIVPLGLTELEASDLEAFLGALQGDGPDKALLTDPGN